MRSLTKTKAQLEELGFPFIGITLVSGKKIFGQVEKFSPYAIYVRDVRGDVLDVPRKIIRRALLLLKGGKEK